MDALVLAAIRGNLLEGYFDQRFPVRLKKGGGLNNCIKDFAVNTFTAMVDASVHFGVALNRPEGTGGQQRPDFAADRTAHRV